MISKYCPLCGAHQFEWYEGEADDPTILEQAASIEELHTRVQQLMQELKKGDKRDDQQIPDCIHPSHDKGNSEGG